MNTRQRRILIAAAIVVVIMLLFPPFNITITSQYWLASTDLGGLAYSFLADPPKGGRVDVALLLAQWIAVGIVGAIAYFICADKKN